MTLDAAVRQEVLIEVEPRLYDPVIVLVAGVLMALGVAMVCSASATVQGTPFDLSRWWNTPLRQAVFAVAGFLMMLFAAHLNYRTLGWNQAGGWWTPAALMLVTVALLGAVLVPGVGRDVLGARRAIYVPGLAFGFQPSEIAKVVLVIWTAALLSRPASRVPPEPRLRTIDVPLKLRHAPPPMPPEPRKSGPHEDIERVNPRDLFRCFLPVLVSGLAVIGLTAVEDFGTAALMGVILFAMLFAAGARLTHLGALMLLGVAGAIGLVIVEPYRVARITTFLNDAPDPQGAGYQINQAMLAIGSGGWWGRGLGNGVQKYGYLPQDNNDFILAIICEELGVAGGVFVTLMFLLLLFRGWRLSATAPDRFGKLLALGLTLTICLQAAFNIGVVTDSVPTKGISLPFVSAGGSGVLFLGAAVGLLASVGRRHTCAAG
jgi:cell division protein FtsW